VPKETKKPLGPLASWAKANANKGLSLETRKLQNSINDYNGITANSANMTVSQPYEIASYNGEDTMKVNGNLVIEDGTGEVTDIGDFVKTMKDRMLILQPNFEAHEKYPALKDAYDQYKMMEKLMMEANNDKDN